MDKREILRITFILGYNINKQSKKDENKKIFESIISYIGIKQKTPSDINNEYELTKLFYSYGQYSLAQMFNSGINWSILKTDSEFIAMGLFDDNHKSKSDMEVRMIQRLTNHVNDNATHYSIQIFFDGSIQSGIFSKLATVSQILAKLKEKSNNQSMHYVSKNLIQCATILRTFIENDLINDSKKVQSSINRRTQRRIKTQCVIFAGFFVALFFSPIFVIEYRILLILDITDLFPILSIFSATFSLAFLFFRFCFDFWYPKAEIRTITKDIDKLKLDLSLAKEMFSRPLLKELSNVTDINRDLFFEYSRQFDMMFNNQLSYPVLLYFSTNRPISSENYTISKVFDSFPPLSKVWK